MNRRKFLEAMLTTSALGLTNCQAKDTLVPPSNPQQNLQNFLSWIKTLQPAQGLGMVNYMNDTKTKLSALASAKLILFYIKTGDTASAKIVADGLIYWQHNISKIASRHVKGAFPSEITLQSNNNPQFGDYFYAGDNLIVIHALYELYKLTKQDSYAQTALSVGYWLEKTLFDGVRYRVWKTNYGMPMHYIRQDGAADNTIHTAVEFLWLVALKDLQQLDSRHGWEQRFQRGIEFMTNAQMESGAWHTFYEPSLKSINGQWKGFQGDNNLTIGDDNLRSALAAQQYGMSANVERFSKWLKPYDDTLLWGYLNPANCQPKFLPTDSPYFDVVCTGMLRTWYRKRNQPDLADKCQTLLNRLQAKDGGWYWAASQGSLAPLNSQEAVITGCWALTDMI